MRRLLPFVFVVAVVYWLAQRSPTVPAEPGSSATPQWQLPVLSHLVVHDFSGAKQSITPGDGQVWVLAVGAAWIKDSFQSARILDEILRERPALRVVGVLADSSMEDSKAYASTLKVNYPQVWATDDYVKTYGLPTSLPRWMVLGRDGRPAASLLPGAPKVELLAALDKVLAQPQK